MPETEATPLLKPAEVAKILSVSRVYVYKMADRGLIPSVRWPGTGAGDKTVLRFREVDILNFITEHRQE